MALIPPTARNFAADPPAFLPTAGELAATVVCNEKYEVTFVHLVFLLLVQKPLETVWQVIARINHLAD